MGLEYNAKVVRCEYNDNVLYKLQLKINWGFTKNWNYVITYLYFSNDCNPLYRKYLTVLQTDHLKTNQLLHNFGTT